MTDLHLTPDEQTMWFYLEPVWTRKLAPYCCWDGTDYELAINEIRTALQHLTGRELILTGAVQDSHELATIVLPSRTGEYPPPNAPETLAPGGIGYDCAPAMLVFTALGQLATIDEDANVDPALHSMVLALLQQHGVDYVPYSATQSELPADIRAPNTYPDTWFQACFSYL